MGRWRSTETQKWGDMLAPMSPDTPISGEAPTGRQVDGRPPMQPDGHVVEVDGRVVSPDDLVARVQALLARLDAEEKASESLPVTGLAALVAPVHEMRALHRGLHPPVVAAGGGPRRRVRALVKKVVRRTTSWYIEPRWQIQEELDAKAIDFSSEAYNSAYRAEAEIEHLRQQLGRIKLELVATTERLRQAHEKIADCADGLSQLRSTISHAAMEEEVRALSKEVTAILARFGVEGTTGADIDYVEFERRFRGESSVIVDGQRRYVAFFPPVGLTGPVVDIGCGSGEMLELLAAEGHDVIGVDLDPDMVAVCHEKGLSALVDDGIHFLSRAADNSLKGVFCAQVVEHLITPELEVLVRESRRALIPEGVLVVETINPRSSFAIGNHYYADTSHVRPVHPETLRYICEQVGFSKVQLEERSPHPALSLRAELPEGPIGEAIGSLLESVFGYQDYVIVATK
jgi:2-polyprenyl-3-methyl-5-hydroxy-6-metoxy-1,4-benzoquinol methylase